MAFKKEDVSLLDYTRSIVAVLVFFVLLLFFTPICVLLLLLSFGKLTNYVIKYFGPLIGRPVLYAAGIDFKIYNIRPDPNRPCIYIINHSTTLDLVILIALGLHGVRFVAKYELLYNPLFYILGKSTGQIFIKREKSDEAIEHLRNTYTRVIENNLSIVMAPEGTRKHKGIIGTFKKGPFRMALDLNYPIVPIYIEGVRHLNGKNNIWVRRGNVTIHIKPDVETGDWTLDNLEKQITRIRKKYLQWANMDDEKTAFG